MIIIVSTKSIMITSITDSKLSETHVKDQTKKPVNVFAFKLFCFKYFLNFLYLYVSIVSEITSMFCVRVLSLATIRQCRENLGLGGAMV